MEFLLRKYSETTATPYMVHCYLNTQKQPGAEEKLCKLCKCHLSFTAENLTV